MFRHVRIGSSALYIYTRVVYTFKYVIHSIHTMLPEFIALGYMVMQDVYHQQ